MNKVWTYVINRDLDAGELRTLEAEGNEFVKGWTAHEQQLTASFDILEGKIVMVKVNEADHGASGCSIDKLTRFVRQAGAKYQVDLMDRFVVAYRDQDHITTTHASKIPEMLANRQMSEDTVVFNTAVSNEKELEHWEQPLKRTWLNKYLKAV